MAFSAVAVRLVHVQAVDAERYAAVGHSQRLRTVDLPAERGTIFDRRGEELALSVRQTTVWANPRLVTDPLRAARALAPVLGAEVAELQEKLSGSGAFVYLARKVNDDVAARVDALELPGVFFLPEPERFLPSGGLAAPLVGKVGLDNEGLSGLEVQFEQQLAGRPGRLVVERDPSGREIPGGTHQHVPSVRGDDLVLTIDRSLQFETERALARQVATSRAKGGMAIVMEVQTGEVVALANLSAGGRGDGPVPAPANQALTAVFEPGSVNKLITVAGALEEGVVGADESFAVPGTIRVGSHTFSEHDPHPVEQWSVTDIVANSSNVGSIMIGHRLGKERLDGYLRAFGFGQPTGLRFPGESNGLLPDPERWDSTSMGTIPIGQGVAVTGLQMLAAYNTVANGGTYVAPKLVKATVGADGEARPTAESATRPVVSERTARELTAMLSEVVRVGTGKLAAIDGYTVAGKTGTARKPIEGVRGYKPGAYVSSFAGFVPAERPALSAIVILDEPTPIYGGLVAAPVFAQVARYALREMSIAPPPPADPTEAPPASPESARPVGEVVGGPTPATTLAPGNATSRSP